MTPTNEQKNILNATGRVVKINARAGTGKTATLLMIAEQKPNQRLLYLVFNSRNRQEAKSKFPSHVDVHTIHSFALSALGINFDGFGAIRPSHYLNDFSANKETLATLTADLIVFFLNSAYAKIDLAIDPFKLQLSDELRKILENAQTEILDIARASLNSWYKTKTDCPHDFYLKLSHLQNKFQNKLAKYNLVLVDEGQDLSPIMIDALSTYQGRIIIVGDSHQQIYSFRYAEDAMQHFTHDELHELTLSFRFGVRIAELSREFIANGKDDQDFAISGTPGKKSQVFLYDNINIVGMKPDTAILCRTNFSLFKNAMHLKTQEQKFCFERDITPELYKTLDVYWLSIGEKTKIKDELIKSFNSLKELEIYATKIDDYQLLKIVELVNEYEPEFPGIVFEFLKLCEEKKDRHARGGAVTLSTIHAAKGHEYENVIIDEDIISRLDGSNNSSISDRIEEINVAYVGITRSKTCLYLPSGMKHLFTKQWQDYASSIPVMSESDANRKAHPIKKPSISSHPARHIPQKTSYRERTENKIEQKIVVLEPLTIGDTVRAPNGYGKIVEIDGDQYLIAMEKQTAHIWERRASLIKVQKVTAATMPQKSRRPSQKLSRR